MYVYIHTYIHTYIYMLLLFNIKILLLYLPMAVHSLKSQDQALLAEAVYQRIYLGCALCTFSVHSPPALIDARAREGEGARVRERQGGGRGEGGRARVRARETSLEGGRETETLSFCRNALHCAA